MRVLTGVTALICMGLPAADWHHAAQAQPIPVPISGPAATDQDGPGYFLTSFELEYFKRIPGLPELQEIEYDAEGRIISTSGVAAEFLDLDVSLGRVRDGFVAQRPGVQAEMMTMRTILESAPTTVYANALDVICRRLIVWYHRESPTFRVHVTPSPDDVDPVTGQDLRRPDRTKLALLIIYDGPSFFVSDFELEYNVAGHPTLPPPEEVLAGVQAMLVPSGDGYVAERPGQEPVAVGLTGRPRAERFTAGAIQEILEAVLEYFTRNDLMAIQVRIAAGQINVNTGVDDRQGTQKLRLVVTAGLIREIRTLARGDRIPVEDRIDNDAHARIRQKSPVQPYVEGDPQRRDVLTRTALDNYLYRLSRHPGRRVDASLAPAEVDAEDGYGVALDYHIAENKPWLLYAQVSNTGTEETEEWRERLGLFNNQLTGNDDILNVDYITASFGDTNAVFGEYDARLLDSEIWRWSVFASWSEYRASDVGFAGELFQGESWQVGAELAWNVYQHKQTFVDLLFGARFQDVDVNNLAVGISGSENFFLPHVGVQLNRHTEEASTNVTATLEWQLGNLTSIDQAELNSLGRLFPDDEWAVLRWDAVQSFYLEPLLNREAWEDIRTPTSSTLAHEIYLRFRGQWGFDYRLIPQEEQVAGGLYSVRGYPESVTAGDTVVLGTVEYRFHLPRAFPYEPRPTTFLGKPFRMVPQYPYGRADWDLILRGFLDIGRTINSDRLAFEEDDTLVGIGWGIELQYKTNVNVRMDWGWALESIPGEVTSGSSQVHFIATILY